ncbi:hypothetical protein GCM10027056_25000 [Glaciibacter psychrotolerans]
MASELHEAKLEIRALRAQLARTAPTIDDLQRQLVAARKQGERYRQQVAALRQSSSWKITKPLRAIRRREANGTN